MSRLSLFVLALIIAIVVLFLTYQQLIIEPSKAYNTTITDILEDPEKYVGKNVIVSGYLRALTIDRVSKDKSEMRYFLQDDSNLIDLIFEKPPEFLVIGKKIIIRAEVVLKDSTLFLKVKEYQISGSGEREIIR